MIRYEHHLAHEAPLPWASGVRGLCSLPELSQLKLFPYKIQPSIQARHPVVFLVVRLLARAVRGQQRESYVLTDKPTGPNPPHRPDVLVDRPCTMGV